MGSIDNPYRRVRCLAVPQEENVPKIVDHAARREELVATTWRLIARHGLAGATLREVAAEAGFSNGALKPYFPTKDSLLKATFEYVFNRTNERVSQGQRRRNGLEAIRAFSREVLPLDGNRRDEARAVVAFWQAAAHDPELAETNNASMRVWRDRVRGWLREASEVGEVRDGLDSDAAIDALITFLLGAQITATLDPDVVNPDYLEAQLESVLEGWASPSGTAAEGPKTTRRGDRESLPA